MTELFEQLQSFLLEHSQQAPFIIFGVLLLAGLNLPVSEDGMLFLSAYLASYNPERTWIFFLFVFLGAYGSDLICYWLGRLLGPKLWRIKWFSKMINPEQIKKINSFFTRYGGLTFIVGRFIPFGVRNGLFLTAGFSRMNFLKFSLFDLVACLLSCSVYFYLYFTFGKAMVDIVKKSNYLVFGLFIMAALILFFLKRRKSKANV